MDIETQTAIKTLLSQAEALLKPLDETEAKDYQQLKIQLLNRDYRDEITFLNQLMSGDLSQFNDAFRARCRERAHYHAGTCLSLAIFSRSGANRLYWAIATLLYKPATLSALLKILLPQVNTQMTFEMVAPLPADASRVQIRQAYKNPSIQLRTQLIDQLTLPPNPDEFKYLIIAGERLLDVRDFSRLDFVRHRQLFDQLQQQYPDLATLLYQHNEAWKRLATDMALIASKGPTYYEVIEQLMAQLKASGSKITLDIYASPFAVTAFKAFLHFLKSIPADAKANLLNLHDLDDPTITLAAVLEHLDKGWCVEVAATNLQKILVTHYDALQARPDLTVEQQQAIAASHSGNPPKTCAGRSMEQKIPPQYEQEYFERLVLQSANDYLQIFMTYPFSSYSAVMQFAQTAPLPVLLGESLNSKALSPAQLSACYTAILGNINKLGGIFKVLAFAIETHNEVLCRLLATTIPTTPEVLHPAIDRLLASNALKSVMDSFFKTEANAQTILELLPDAIKAVFITRLVGVSSDVHILNIALAALDQHNHPLFSAILAQCSFPQRLSLLKPANSSQFTRLYAAPTSLMDLFNGLSPDQLESLRYLIINNRAFTTIIHQQLDNPAVFKCLFPRIFELFQADEPENTPWEQSAFFQRLLEGNEAAVSHFLNAPSSTPLVWSYMIKHLSQDPEKQLNLLKQLPLRGRLHTILACEPDQVTALITTHLNSLLHLLEDSGTRSLLNNGYFKLPFENKKTMLAVLPRLSRDAPYVHLRLSLIADDLPAMRQCLALIYPDSRIDMIKKARQQYLNQFHHQDNVPYTSRELFSIDILNGIEDLIPYGALKGLISKLTPTLAPRYSLFQPCSSTSQQPAAGVTQDQVAQNPGLRLRLHPGYETGFL